MNTQQSVEYIQELEARYDLNKFNVLGFNCWPIVRIYLGYDLDDFTKQEGREKKKDGARFDKVLLLLKDVLSLIKIVNKYFYLVTLKKRKESRANILFLTYSSAFRLIGGKRTDLYMSPIKANIQDLINPITLLYTNKEKNDFNSLDSEINIDAFLSTSKILALLKSTFKPIPFGLKNEVQRIIDEFDQKGITHTLSAKKVWFRVLYMRVLANYLKPIMQKVDPKYVFGSNYYGLELAMNLAAHELGITSVDVQHGVQGESHFAYAAWNNIPNGGYEVMPDLFMTWDEHAASVINSWAKHTTKHSAKVGGNMTILSSLSLGSDYELNSYSDNSNILITLQPGRNTLSFYKELINKYSKACNWWVRLHPNMLDRTQEIADFFEQECSDKNVIIEKATSIPLYELLSIIDIHITETSSVILDAKYFGINSIAIHESAISLFKNEFTQESLYKAETADECILLLDNRSIYKDVRSKKELLNVQNNLLSSFLEEIGLTS